MVDKEVSEQQAVINQKIDKAQHRIAELENQLRLVDIELEDLFQDRQQYILLSEISDRLDKLNKLGGACLFWGEGCDVEESMAHYHRVDNLVINYDEKVKGVQKHRELIKEDIQSVIAQINILHEEILVVQERAEERLTEFVIEREMTVHPYRPMIMPWTTQGDDEKRFRKIMLITLLFTLVLGYLIPLWDLPLQTRDELTEVPERLAKLMVKKQPPPPPPKVQPKLEKLDKKDKKPRKDVPKPKTEKAKKARKVAETAGLLAFKDNFSELMDSSVDQKLGSQARLSNKGQKARKVSRSLVTAQAEGASGGISTSSLSRNTGSGGKSIGGVGFSRVESAIGSDFFGEERPLSDGPGPSRTDEEIQIVFDRYKAALYRIYNRELRKNPTLQGKLVLKLTIETNGKVSACSLESSDMEAPALEKKIVERVKKFNFGAKEGVPAITILYPIDFLPAT
ncbi:MAG: energy transducer TonB [endosymbiont of Galathealinum brachiosum]|uniref:Energy transducer TonB n=1 Tax=endosymbiont of Galathealinum brachiosum TaxID=2200906 RepID=A0A370D8D9_9GAMM|nr:MAG: energy transducer TonB [endosymbiont of Galathealinum brachiosum]